MFDLSSVLFVVYLLSYFLDVGVTRHSNAREWSFLLASQSLDTILL